MTGVIDIMNTFFWVASNVLVAYIGILLFVFIIVYLAIFEPRATRGGRLVLQFTISIFLIVFLVFLGVYVDPPMGRAWFLYEGQAADWRPAVRFITYAFVSYSITSLVVFLIKRKFQPHKFTDPQDRDFVKTRHETGPSPIVKS